MKCAKNQYYRASVVACINKDRLELWPNRPNRELVDASPFSNPQDDTLHCTCRASGEANGYSHWRSRNEAEVSMPPQNKWLRFLLGL